MEKKYDWLVGKNEDNLANINKTLLRQLQTLRDQWVNLHKNKLLEYCTQAGIPIDEMTYNEIWQEHKTISQ